MKMLLKKVPVSKGKQQRLIIFYLLTYITYLYLLYLYTLFTYYIIFFTVIFTRIPLKHVKLGFNITHHKWCLQNVLITFNFYIDTFLLQNLFNKVKSRYS